MQISVKTYKDMARWSKSFADGAFGLFFLIGHQGQGKSTALRDLLLTNAKAKAKPEKKSVKPDLPRHKGQQNPDAVKEPLWVEGGAVSAFKLYQLLWEHQHQTIVFDDIDSVYHDRNLIRLLKALCQTEKEKGVGWHTDARQLQAAGIPAKFWTTSRVCIIANRWKNLNEHVGSLVDRGMLVNFKPPPQEVFAFAKAHLNPEKDILAYVKEYLWMVDELSLRVFIVAGEAKKYKLDWKSAVAEELGIRDVLLIKKLEGDRSYTSTEQRAMEFQRQTGLSRPMFFKAVQRYKDLMERHPDKARRRKPTMVMA